MEIINNMNDTKKNGGGCHHLLLVYDASKLSTVSVVKLPVLGLQRAPENSELAPSVLVLSDLLYCVCMIYSDEISKRYIIYKRKLPQFTPLCQSLIFFFCINFIVMVFLRNK